MSAAAFPKQQPGLNYLTEGGRETEIMYKYGFDLPHFAMFPCSMTRVQSRSCGGCRRRPRQGDDVQQRARGVRIGACRVPRESASGRVVHAGPRRPPAGAGPSVKDAIETIDAQTGDDRPAFYGIHCSHPLEFMPAIEPGEWFQRVRNLRPNAAMMDKISLCALGHLEMGDPPKLGELMGELAR